MNAELKALYTQLEETTDPVAKVDILGRLALHFTHNDLDRCLAVANDMIALAEPIGYMEGLADAWHARARVSTRSMKYDDAVEQLQQALGYLENSNNLVLKAKMYDGLGVTYSHMGQFELSIGSSQKAIDLYEEANEPMGLKANGYNNIANSYARMGNITEAEVYFQKALDVVVARGDIHKTPNLRVNLAIIKGMKGQKEQALEEFKQCLAEYEAMRHKAGVAETNLNMAHIYRSEKNHADATRHYVKAIAVFKEIENKQSLAAAYVGLAKVYMTLGGWAEAMQQINASEKIFETITHPNGKIEMLKTKAAILNGMGRTEEAERIQDEVEAYAAEYGIDVSVPGYQY